MHSINRNNARINSNNDNNNDGGGGDGDGDNSIGVSGYNGKGRYNVAYNSVTRYLWAGLIACFLLLIYSIFLTGSAVLPETRPIRVPSKADGSLDTFFSSLDEKWYTHHSKPQHVVARQLGLPPSYFDTDNVADTKRRRIHRYHHDQKSKLTISNPRKRLILGLGSDPDLRSLLDSIVGDCKNVYMIPPSPALPSLNRQWFRVWLARISSSMDDGQAHQRRHHHRPYYYYYYLPITDNLLVRLGQITTQVSKSNGTKNVDATGALEEWTETIMSLNRDLDVQVDLIVLREYILTSLKRDAIRNHQIRISQVVDRARGIFRVVRAVDAAFGSNAIHEWRIEAILHHAHIYHKTPRNTTTTTTTTTISATSPWIWMDAWLWGQVQLKRCIATSSNIDSGGHCSSNSNNYDHNSNDTKHKARMTWEQAMVDWDPNPVFVKINVNTKGTMKKKEKRGKGGNNNITIASILRWIARLSAGDLKRLPPLPHLAIWRPNPSIFVAIAQVRNVAHTLPSFIESLSWIADRILLLDTGSTDDTIRLVREWGITKRTTTNRRSGDGSSSSSKNATGKKKKVEIRRAPSSISDSWDEGNAYKSLLTWARGEHQESGRLRHSNNAGGGGGGGGTIMHVLCPDSDEYLTANWRRHDLLRYVLLSLPPKTALSVRLFHVYDGLDQWISKPQHQWGQVQKAPIGWCDDGIGQRSMHRHHINRVPNGYRTIGLHSARVLGAVHFKFVSLEAMTVKTIWYRHLEFDSGSERRATGSFYANKMPKKRISSSTVMRQMLSPVPKNEWYSQALQSNPTWIEAFQAPENWDWRVRMVEAWRAKWRLNGRVTHKSLALPRNWPLGISFVSDYKNPLLNKDENKSPKGQEEEEVRKQAGPLPSTTTTTTTGTNHNALDIMCRNHWLSVDKTSIGSGGGNKQRKFSNSWGEILPVHTSISPTSDHENQDGFLWVIAPDRTIPNWLFTHEKHVRRFVGQSLAVPGACSNDGGGEGIVIDVGANSGYYGLWGLSAGCRTLFVEPQPYCAMLLEASLGVNGWLMEGGDGIGGDQVHRVQLLRAAAGDENRARGLKVWCDTPCYGRVGAPGVGPPTRAMTKNKPGSGVVGGNPHDGQAYGFRPMVRIEDHIWFATGLSGEPVRVALLKIDVEGAEASVLRGMRSLFERRMIQRATVEITPQFYKAWGKEAAMRQEIWEELRRIQDSGYKISRPQGRDTHYVAFTGTNAQKDLYDYLIHGRFNQHDVFITLEQ